MKYIELAKEALEEKYILGARGLTKDESYQVGDDVRPSYEWDLEHDCSTYFTTGELAGGTCCIEVKMDVETAEELAANIEEAIKKASKYGDVGRDTVILAGRSTTRNDYQMDDDEIRIKNAWVEAIVNE
ncbi:hypothetical protein [Paenibacillus medicaginis]|uniref:Phage protein n=1 Tax=Paenibacillus medicaginis TaxID=1470560 RepID=A0ABV5C0N8_9BACL